MRLTLLLVCCGGPLFAQTTFQQLFAGQSGEELLESIEDQYEPTAVLSEDLGKDLLYSVINNRNDSVTCVYTGYRIYLDPQAADPSQAVFAQNINLEHTYPKSQLVDGPAERDLHHLFPTLADVNQRRGSLPFRELNDSQVDEWYLNQQTFLNVPTSNIDAYSEYQSNLGFEPREDHKGNAARAMFYIYALYPGAADAPFFQQQRGTLCDWHFLDPADNAELQRSNRVAVYQGTPNPFVIDCTLAQRTFCEDQALACEPVRTREPDALLGEVTASPQPAAGGVQLQFTLRRAGRLDLEVFDQQGRLLQRYALGQRPAGSYRMPLDLAGYHGLAAYRLRLTTDKGRSERGGRLLLL